jgi:hypothetical protein
LAVCSAGFDDSDGSIPAAFLGRAIVAVAGYYEPAAKTDRSEHRFFGGKRSTHCNYEIFIGD